MSSDSNPKQRSSSSIKIDTDVFQSLESSISNAMQNGADAKDLSKLIYDIAKKQQDSPSPLPHSSISNSNIYNSNNIRSNNNEINSSSSNGVTSSISPRKYSSSQNNNNNDNDDDIESIITPRKQHHLSPRNDNNSKKIKTIISSSPRTTISSSPRKTTKLLQLERQQKRTFNPFSCKSFLFILCCIFLSMSFIRNSSFSKSFKHYLLMDMNYNHDNQHHHESSSTKSKWDYERLQAELESSSSSKWDSTYNFSKIVLAAVDKKKKEEEHDEENIDRDGLQLLKALNLTTTFGPEHNHSHVRDECPLDHFFHQKCHVRSKGKVCIFPSLILKRVTSDLYYHQEMKIYQLLKYPKYFPRLIYRNDKCHTMLQENVAKPQQLSELGNIKNRYTASYTFYKKFYTNLFENYFNPNSINPRDLNACCNTIIYGKKMHVIDFGMYKIYKNTTALLEENGILQEQILAELRKLKDEYDEDHERKL